jgi:hypothetical protein
MLCPFWAALMAACRVLVTLITFGPTGAESDEMDDPVSDPPTSKASTLKYLPVALLGSRQILTVCCPEASVPVLQTVCR